MKLSKPPAISDLQLDGDDLTRPPFYCFTDYLDLLNERIHALSDIVKEHHNQTFEKRFKSMVQRVHPYDHSTRVILCICHFPSKTIITIQKAENDLCWTALHFSQT